MASKYETNTASIITIGVISAILLVVIIVGVQAWFTNEQNEEMSAKWDMSPNTALIDLRTQQQEKLGTYRWIDREKKTVAIPVADAMRIMVETHGKLPTTRPGE